MQPLTSATSSGVTLSLGIINVTVSVHGAVGEDDSASLRNVCTFEHEPSTVKQKLLCPICEGLKHDAIVAAAKAGDAAKVVELLNAEPAPLEKAKEMPEGLVVIPEGVITQAKEASAAFKKQVNLTMHPAGEVTGVLMPSGKSYYLSMKSPNAGQVQAYRLLVHLVRTRPDRAFMGKFTLRSATSLFQLCVAGDDTLVLRQMADAELVREHPQIPALDLPAALLDMSDQFVDMSTTPFLVAEHGSGKTQIIAEYAATQTPTSTPVVAGVATGGNVLDLTAQLAAQLAARQGAEPASVPKPARKTAARRTPKAS